MNFLGFEALWGTSFGWWTCQESATQKKKQSALHTEICCTAKTWKKKKLSTRRAYPVPEPIAGSSAGRLKSLKGGDRARRDLRGVFGLSLGFFHFSLALSLCSLSLFSLSRLSRTWSQTVALCSSKATESWWRRVVRLVSFTCLCCCSASVDALAAAAAAALLASAKCAKYPLPPPTEPPLRASWSMATNRGSWAIAIAIAITIIISRTVITTNTGYATVTEHSGKKRPR